jgi:signal transduction histidine kinase
VTLVRVELHDRASGWWQPIAAIVLVGVLVALATLQYRWLGEVRDAERERMRANLRTRASEFSQEFDGELTRAYVAFRLTSDQMDKGADAAMSQAYAQWKASTHAPGIVRGVYVAEGQSFDSATIRRFDPDRHLLENSEWPPDLKSSLAQTRKALPRIISAPQGLPPMMMADAVDSRAPAFVVVVPYISRAGGPANTTYAPDPSKPARVIIVALDRAKLQSQLVEPLVEKYFGAGDDGEYHVTIARRDEPNAIVYNSTAAPLRTADAEVTTPVFGLRTDDMARLAELPGASLPLPANTKMAITIVRRTTSADGTHVLVTGGEEQGAWIVRLRHRDGSLDAIVAQSRRRNMAISMGVLGLLGSSVLLVIASAQRQRRLARQQMEFVASVSHELRTPLAVICSAGENLADGIVAETGQVRKYGSVIETEGRRLGDMVERVMAFAGMSSGARIQSRAEVNLSSVITEAVDAVRHDARDRRVAIEMNVSAPLPVVSGDAAALRSAVQNIVGNAVKYSAQGAAVRVDASAGHGAIVEIRVADRGLGIDADDLPHIFKPFFRGRRAVDAQVRGSGIGLSVVRHVVRAHDGDVSVDSRVGEGTTVTIVLPGAAAGPGRTAVRITPARARS